MAFCARRCGIVRRRCGIVRRRCGILRAQMWHCASQMRCICAQMRRFSALVRRFFGARATVFRRSCDVICDKVFSDPKVFSDRPFLLYRYPVLQTHSMCVNVNTTDATTGATALLLPAQNTHMCVLGKNE